MMHVPLRQKPVTVRQRGVASAKMGIKVISPQHLIPQNVPPRRRVRGTVEIISDLDDSCLNDNFAGEWFKEIDRDMTVIESRDLSAPYCSHLRTKVSYPVSFKIGL